MLQVVNETSLLLSPCDSNVHYNNEPPAEGVCVNGPSRSSGTINAKSWLSFFLSFFVSTTMFLIILILQVSVRVLGRIQTVPMSKYPHIVVLILCFVNIPIEWLLKSSSSFISLDYNPSSNSKEDPINKIQHQYYNYSSGDTNCHSNSSKTERVFAEQSSVIKTLINNSDVIKLKKYMLLFAAFFDICNIMLQIFSLTYIIFSIDVMFLQQLSIPIGLIICKLIFFKQVTYTYKQYFGSILIVGGVCVYFYVALDVWRLYLLSKLGLIPFGGATALSSADFDQFVWYVLYLCSYAFTGFSWLLRERAICQTDPNDDEYVALKVKENLTNFSNYIQFLLAIGFTIVVTFLTTELNNTPLTWTEADISVLVSSAKDMMFDLADGLWCAAGQLSSQSRRNKVHSTDIHISQCSYSYMYIMSSIIANILYSFIVLNLLRYCHGHSNSEVHPRSHIYRSSPGGGGHLTRFLDVLGRGDNSRNSLIGMNIFWRASLVSFPLTYFVSSLVLEPAKDKVFTPSQLIAVMLVTVGLSLVVISPVTRGLSKRKKTGLVSRLGNTSESDLLATDLNDISLGSVVSPLSLKDSSSPYRDKTLGENIKAEEDGARKISWSSTHAHEILPWNQPLDYLYPYAGTLHFHTPTGGAGAVRDVKFLKTLNAAYQTVSQAKSDVNVTGRSRQNSNDSLVGVMNTMQNEDIEPEVDIIRRRRSTIRPRISLDPIGDAFASSNGIVVKRYSSIGGGGNRESMLSAQSSSSGMSERSLRRLSSFANKSIKSAGSASNRDVVVIDLGSYQVRAGFAEGYAPKAVFPSVVSSVLTGERHRPQYCVGNPVLQHAATYVKPYKNGNVAGDHWEDMEAIYEHCFTDCLDIDTAHTKVFLTEAHQTSKKSREMMIETMFELFEVEATYLHNQPTLALFASGLTSGCVVDMGEYSSTVYPVAEGYHLTNASIKVGYGGANVTQNIAQHFIDKGFHQSLRLPVDFVYDRINATSLVHTNIINTNNQLFNFSQSIQVARDIKEKFGYVSTVPFHSRNLPLSAVSAKKHNKANHASHTLPDGTRVSLPLENLFECTDVLFQPSLMNSDEDGLHSAIYKSISKCDVDLRRSLFSNITLSGGNCMLRGMPDRITAELKRLAPATASNYSLGTGVQFKVNRTSWSDSSTAVWKGGSVIASISTFDERWISILDYEEYGSNIVHEKCPTYL